MSTESELTLEQLVTEYVGYDNCGDEVCISYQAKLELLDKLQALITRREQEAVTRQQAMHCSDVARAVGILEGLGHPDEYLTKRLAYLTNPTPADSLNLSKSKGLKPAGDGDAEKPKTEHYLSQNGNSPIECICGKSFTAFDDAKMHIDQVVIGIYADGLTGLFGADTPTKTENEK